MLDISSADAALREECTQSRELLRGRLLHVFADEVRLPDGRLTQREYIRHPGAVAIIPLLEGADGSVQLVMERQFRYPVGRAVLEFPAGKRDAGEEPLACAQRELREETGYTARQWARAGQLHPTVAYSTESIDIWFARGLQRGERALDVGEFLDVLTVTPGELLAACRDGLVTDSKTLVGALWLQNVLGGVWTLDWQDAP